MVKKALFLFVFVSLMSGSLYAGGYQLYSESSADVVGLAGAVVGRNDIFSAAWYNPSSLVGLERPMASFGGTAIKLSASYTLPNGATSNMSDAIRYTGFFYGAVPIDNNHVFALSVNAPYGMITHWSSHWQENTLGTYTCLRNVYITPSIVWRVNDELSVSVGFNVVHGLARLAKMIDATSYGLPKNKLYMRADGYGVGYTASVFYRPFEHWSFGAHYQSRVKVKYEGRSDFRYEGNYLGGNLQFRNGDVDTTLYVPSFLAFGVANTSFEKLTLSADVVWTEWVNYDCMKINFDRFPGNGKKGVSNARRDWDNAWSVRLGAEYQLTQTLALRLGYMYDKCPGNSETNSPEMPDADKHYFSIGACYDTGDWAIDLGYAYVLFGDSRIGKDQKAVPWKNGRGKFKVDCHILSAQYTVRF